MNRIVTIIDPSISGLANVDTFAHIRGFLVYVSSPSTHKIKLCKDISFHKYYRQHRTASNYVIYMSGYVLQWSDSGTPIY